MPSCATAGFDPLGVRYRRSRLTTCHRSFPVDLDHVRELRDHGAGELELELDPPVNAAVPLARSRRHALLARRALLARLGRA